MGMFLNHPCQQVNVDVEQVLHQLPDDYSPNLILSVPASFLFSLELLFSFPDHLLTVWGGLIHWWMLEIVCFQHGHQSCIRPQSTLTNCHICWQRQAVTLRTVIFSSKAVKTTTHRAKFMFIASVQVNLSELKLSLKGNGFLTFLQSKSSKTPPKSQYLFIFTLLIHCTLFP